MKTANLGRYMFGKNINGSGDEGIVDLESMSIMCACDQSFADMLLPSLNNPLNEKLDSQDFHDVMSLYRMAEMTEQDKVVRRFEAVKTFLSSNKE